MSALACCKGDAPVQSDATRFRRTTAGLCLILGPLLLFLGDLLGARGPADQRAFLDAIAQNPAANYADITHAVSRFALPPLAVMGIAYLLRH